MQLPASASRLCAPISCNNTHSTEACSYQYQHQDSVLQSAVTTDTQNWSMQLPASASRLCAPISCNNTHSTEACSYQHQHRDSVLRSAATTHTALKHAVTSISNGTLCSDQLQQQIHRTEACGYQHQQRDSVLQSAATTDTQNWSMQLPASASGLCAPISCNNRYTELKHAVTSISIRTLCSDQLQQQIHRTGACSYQHQQWDSVLRSATTTHTQNWSMQLPASAMGLCAPISCNNRWTELKHARLATAATYQTSSMSWSSRATKTVQWSFETNRL